MSLDAVGWLLVIIGLVLFVYGYHVQRERIRQDDWIGFLIRAAHAEDDHYLSAFERLPLYDWSARGDFE